MGLVKFVLNVVVLRGVVKPSDPNGIVASGRASIAINIFRIMML